MHILCIARCNSKTLQRVTFQRNKTEMKKAIMLIQPPAIWILFLDHEIRDGKIYYSRKFVNLL